MKSTLSMPQVAQVEHHWVQLSDGKIHLATVGAGEPVVLLPGMGMSWWQWRELMPLLADAGFRVLALDLRGEAWSDLPSAALTRTRRSEDVLDLLDRLELDRAHLVSHDLGSIAAYQLCLEHPDRFISQVLLAVPPPQLQFTIRMVPGMAQLWHQELLAIPALGPWLLRHGPLPGWLLGHFAARELPAEVTQLYTALLRDPATASGISCLCRRMLLPELLRITRGVYREQLFMMPTLFCFGTQDGAFPPPIVKQVFAQTTRYGPEVKLEMIEGAGHYLSDEQPTETNQVILQFLEESSSAPTST